MASSPARPRHPDDEVDGGFSSLLFDYDCQLAAVDQHSAAEGKDVATRVVLDSYDRTLHPWLHGRRFGDIVETLRGVFAR